MQITPSKDESGKQEFLKAVEHSLVMFDRSEMHTAVRGALDAGAAPDDVVRSIRNGFEQVSKRYEEGEFFLSELIMTGETAKVALEILEPHFKTSPTTESAKVVLGTVEGDVHDIGKNIVSIILSSSGFTVYDLGVDVKPHDFVDRVRETGAEILGMSALLTTTMLNMGTVIEDLKRSGLRDSVKVVIGGQPITNDFAREIGADAYVDDAPKVLSTLNELLRA